MRSDRDAQSVTRDSIFTTQLFDLVSVVGVVDMQPIDSFRLDVVGEWSTTSRNW